MAKKRANSFSETMAGTLRVPVLGSTRSVLSKALRTAKADRNVTKGSALEAATLVMKQDRMKIHESPRGTRNCRRIIWLSLKKL